MSKPRRTSPFQLLVEGPDDQWVIINLLQRNGYSFEDAAAGTVRHDAPKALRFVAWFSDLFQVRPTREV